MKINVIIGQGEKGVVYMFCGLSTFTFFECTHFYSFLPSIYKFGLLSTLLYRYFSISSNFQLYLKEVQEFKEIFLRNGFPSKFIDAPILQFFKKLSVMKVIKDTVPKRDYLIALPYLGTLSNKIQRRMKKVFLEILPYGKVHIVFKSTFRSCDLPF